VAGHLGWARGGEHEARGKSGHYSKTAKAPANVLLSRGKVLNLHRQRGSLMRTGSGEKKKEKVKNVWVVVLRGKFGRAICCGDR